METEDLVQASQWEEYEDGSSTYMSALRHSWCGRGSKTDRACCRAFFRFGIIARASSRGKCRGARYDDLENVMPLEVTANGVRNYTVTVQSLHTCPDLRSVQYSHRWDS